MEREGEGGLIIPDVLRKRNQETRVNTSTRRNETGSKTTFTLPHLTLLLQRGIILFAKIYVLRGKKNPSSPFLFH